MEDSPHAETPPLEKATTPPINELLTRRTSRLTQRLPSRKSSGLLVRMHSNTGSGTALNVKKSSANPRLVRLASRKPSLKLELSMKRNRFCIIDELITTEERYVSLLDILIERYATPCSHVESLSGSFYKTVFGDVISIHKLNTLFLNKLHNIYSGVFTLGDPEDDQRFEALILCFLRFVEVFKIYAFFINNHQKSHKMISDYYRDNLIFKNICNKVDPKLNGPTGIFGLLINPVQRVPRYSLLINELYKNTLPADRSKNLRELKTKVEGLAELINQSKRIKVRQDVMMEYAETLTNFAEVIGEELVMAGRLFSSEFEMMCYFNKKIFECVLLLFSDTVLICKRKKRRLIVLFGAKAEFCHVHTNFNQNTRVKEIYQEAINKSHDRAKMVLKEVLCLELIGKSNKNQKPKNRIFMLWQNGENQNSTPKVETSIVIAGRNGTISNNTKMRLSLAL
ncbi:Rho/RAC guanine nucleotide exchange factor, putative [Entamoeba invadens IP1]|uniref:Rho/RAC guanine nucleotide exchange factor, putative n=1 Tax=Entamoeba invadens IP1 TaxID=370355 RepID=UPI0002C3E576|nr:Rho/RAC guanine nucleotide exchange factor, putative [Entamoeba invadens IP1]ELP90767.1 Rho/RAC guanine nucleotide exchange factor, putative [Entamoeba invadens IP1]|eukprot:XP_004257538.1 Rho/RAC guanine nucleotide exchange factor, putative [Entamoeba invadens IP1]